MIPYETHLTSLRPDAVARKVLLVSAAVTLALYLIPFGRYLARPLLLLSTLAHELGHGLTALLLGGRFERLEMWANGAGVAHLDLAGFGRIRQALTLAGGLVGPSVAAALCFTLGKTGQGARWCLIGVGLLLVAVELLVMRNLFGFLFAGVVAAACLFAAARCSPETAQWVVLFLGVQLALSVFSRADYLFKRTADNPTGVYPSDVMQMQWALFLPYWLWGLLCGAFAVLVLLYGLRTVWGR